MQLSYQPLACISPEVEGWYDVRRFAESEGERKQSTKLFPMLGVALSTLFYRESTFLDCLKTFREGILYVLTHLVP